MRTERRKKPRFLIRQMIELSMGRENFIPAEGVNISEEGMLCRTGESLDLYSRVSLQMSLLGKKEFSFACEGVVVRCKKNRSAYDTAVEFADLSDSEKKKIHTLVN